MLTDLDKELEKRGHAFCRYADDCNIYVKSEKAGERVLESIAKFIEKKLKLKVNGEKSDVDNPWKRKFLGFSFTSHYKSKIRVHKKSIEKLKKKVKTLCRRGKSQNLKTFITKELNPVIRGWGNYFQYTDGLSFTKELDAWIRRRLRVLSWRQWGKVKVKYRKLAKQGIPPNKSYMMANSSKGPWRMSGFKDLATALPYNYFEKEGLVSLYKLMKCKLREL